MKQLKPAAVCRGAYPYKKQCRYLVQSDRKKWYCVMELTPMMCAREAQLKREEVYSE